MVTMRNPYPIYLMALGHMPLVGKGMGRRIIIMASILKGEKGLKQSSLSLFRPPRDGIFNEDKAENRVGLDHSTREFAGPLKMKIYEKRKGC